MLQGCFQDVNWHWVVAELASTFETAVSEAATVTQVTQGAQSQLRFG